MGDKKDELVVSENELVEAAETEDKSVSTGFGGPQLSPADFMQYLNMMRGRPGRQRLTKKKVTRAQRRRKRNLQKAARKANRGINQGKRAVKHGSHRCGF